MKKQFHVGISGSYGGMNLGDEAILQSIIEQLRYSLPVELTVFTRNAEDTKRRHHVERAVLVRDLTRDEVIPEIKRLDLLILGGGGIIYDREVDIFLRELEIAQEENIPTMVYAVSAGPLYENDSRSKVKETLSKVNAITVRDREAKKILENIGVQNEIIVTADPALLLKREPLTEDVLKQEGLIDEHCLIGISVREPGPAAPDINPTFYHDLIANAADFMISRLNAKVVFIPFEELDVKHSHAVIANMLRPNDAWVLKREYSSAQLLSILRQFDFLLGMRLHFLIFAALQGVPFVALPYAPKVGGFLEELQIPMLPLERLNAGLINAYIDKAWDEKNKTIRNVKQLLPELKKHALENNKIAVNLLKDKD